MSQVRFDFGGKVAVVTGGGGGIGSAIARGLMTSGAKVAILDVKQENAQAVAHELDPSGQKTLAIGCDLTRSEDIQSAVDSVVNKFGRIDQLVNSIGVNFRKPLLDLPYSELQAMVSVNFIGVLLTCRTVARVMMKNEGPSKIVNIASMGAWRGTPNYVVYNATKAAVVTLTKALANEWIKYNIYVNAICPGPTLTSFTKAYYDEDPSREQGVIKRTPAGRVGEPEDHVGPTLFLLSDASNWLLGQAIISDGGMSLD